MQERPSKKNSLAVLKRVFRYMMHYYKLPFTMVVLCILISAIASVIGATFPQTLVDDYIVPMLQTGSTDFSGLAADIQVAGHTPKEVYDYACRLLGDHGGVGIYDTFVHVDVRSKKSRFDYRKKK